MGLVGDISGVAVKINFQRRGLLAPAIFLATSLAGCATWITYGDGILKGRVVVQWASEDKFIYLKTSNPLSFQPSFMNTPIVPETMYTDGGSIPRIFWSIPGLSPWGLGPAYVIHDWLFEVHRCHRPAPPEVAAITFEQSAQVLAEVGKSLVEAGLVQNNKLEEIVWAIRTQYARNIWDSAPTPDECAIPVVSAKARARLGLAPTRTVVDFVIPQPPRR
jgi:uncharacterized protein DUF1353